MKQGLFLLHKLLGVSLRPNRLRTQLGDEVIGMEPCTADILAADPLSQQGRHCPGCERPPLPPVEPENRGGCGVESGPPSVEAILPVPVLGAVWSNRLVPRGKSTSRPTTLSQMI